MMLDFQFYHEIASKIPSIKPLPGHISIVGSFGKLPNQMSFMFAVLIGWIKRGGSMQGIPRRVFKGNSALEMEAFQCEG